MSDEPLPLTFPGSSEEYLIRQLSRGKAILFVGAGFSGLATNRLGRPLPDSRRLAELIWQVLEFDEPFDTNSSLGELFDVLLTSGIQHSTISNFLEQNLLTSSIPEAYCAITKPFWYRIYTTNVDDLVERVYVAERTPLLDILAYPSSDTLERDPLLEHIQCVHLNGRLPCSPADVTFSPRQYGQAAAQPQPLYQQFISDYGFHSIVFVGTRFQEPLFWQYLAAREKRDPRATEHRPESFLIAPQISLPKRSLLKGLNITPVEGDTDQFLRWLTAVQPVLPSRLETIRASQPGLAKLIEDQAANRPTILPRDNEAFGLSFTPVPTESPSSDRRSWFLMGAAPRWEDMFLNLDAPREISETILAWLAERLRSEGDLAIGAILGSAGSGKSTILRRVGIRLAQAGFDVFSTNSESLPPPEVISAFVNSVPRRVLLLFDNSEVALGQLSDLSKRLARCPRPPVMFIASRTNDFDRLTGRLSGSLAVTEFEVPNLSRDEIKSILLILTKRGLLGDLNGKSEREQIAIFEEKARRQILVAMREATQGQGFNEIISDEFERLVPQESKMLYLCVAIATQAGYRLTREEVLGCARVPIAEALNLLNRNLRDIVIHTGADRELLLLRHQLIAEEVVDRLASRSLLSEAYVRVLMTLAPAVRRSHWRSRVIQLYRRITNHKTIYGRFKEEIDEARAIFDALIPYLSGDANFWLQYGNLELEGKGGELSLAENYLNQAESLDGRDPYIKNALAHLRFRKARIAKDIGTARADRDEVAAELLERIKAGGFDDIYAVHIYSSQRYYWALKWLTQDDPERDAELRHVESVLSQACEVNPRNRRLRELRESVKRSLLISAIPPEQRPADPPPPD